MGVHGRRLVTTVGVHGRVLACMGACGCMQACASMCGSGWPWVHECACACVYACLWACAGMPGHGVGVGLCACACEMHEHLLPFRFASGRVCVFEFASVCGRRVVRTARARINPFSFVALKAPRSKANIINKAFWAWPNQGRCWPFSSRAPCRAMMEFKEFDQAKH